MLHYIRTMLHARLSERGASAVEYGLLIAAVVLLCIGGLEALGWVVQGEFSSANTTISDP